MGHAERERHGQALVWLWCTGGRPRLPFRPRQVRRLPRQQPRHAQTAVHRRRLPSARRHQDGIGSDAHLQHPMAARPIGRECGRQLQPLAYPAAVARRGRLRRCGVHRLGHHRRQHRHGLHRWRQALGCGATHCGRAPLPHPASRRRPVWRQQRDCAHPRSLSDVGERQGRAECPRTFRTVGPAPADEHAAGGTLREPLSRPEAHRRDGRKARVHGERL